MNFESLCTYLEAVHGLYGGLRGRRVVVGHEPEALGEVGLFVYEHFGRDHVAERQERGREVGVCELLRQVVYEQVAAFWTWKVTFQTIRETRLKIRSNQKKLNRALRRLTCFHCMF